MAEETKQLNQKLPRGGLRCSLLLVRQAALMALSLMLFLLIVNRIAFPLYRDQLARDITLEIRATGTACEDALANNVRLRHIYINNAVQDLSGLPLNGDWKYNNVDDFLYLYNTDREQTLVYEFQNVLQMELTFVREVGSGVVELWVDGRLWKSLDLYQNCVWETTSVAYEISPLISLERNPAACGVLFLLCLGLSCLVLWFGRPDVTWKMRKLARSHLWTAVLSAAVFFLIYLIQYQSTQDMWEFFRQGTVVAIEGYLVLYLMMLMLHCLTGSHWISCTITAVIWELLLVISEIKERAKGVPLLPWDYQMTGEALSVAGNYQLMPTWTTLGAVLATASLLFLLARYERKRRNPWKTSLPKAAARAAMTASVFAACAVFLNTTVLCGYWSNTEASRVYQIGKYYNTNGFVVSFLEYTNYLQSVAEPEDYSQQTMAQITGQLLDAPAQQEVQSRPNVIVVMSESFWDVTSLEQVSFLEDPLPNFRQLQSESAHGELLSHVFGGNTVVSEFEALTGFSGNYFPTDYMVYGDSIKASFFSVVDVLEAQGYHTMAVHPYLASNYNRNVAYERFGFDEVFFEDAFSEDTERVRNYVSDKAIFDFVTERFEAHQSTSEEPFFAFCVTMQNQGGYWGETLHGPTQTEFVAEGYQPTTIECMGDYFAGLRSSDQALGALVDYFRDKEDTLIVYFGDHMSDAGGLEEKMLSRESWYHPETFSYALESHRVPFLIWSNQSSESQNLGLMEISRLLPTAFSRQGIAVPPFWKHLVEMNEIYAAANGAGFYSAQGQALAAEAAADSCKEAWDIYELIQYDYIWGSAYGQKLFSLDP